MHVGDVSVSALEIASCTLDGGGVDITQVGGRITVGAGQDDGMPTSQACEIVDDAGGGRCEPIAGSTRDGLGAGSIRRLGDGLVLRVLRSSASRPR